MGQTADQLRQEIEAKREDAASKIDQIEARVTDTAQMARDTVTGTVDQVKGTVTDTVDQVKQSVQNIDVRKLAEERPLAALGAALAGGFVLGGLLRGGGGGQGGHPNQYPGLQTGGLRGVAKSSGLDDTIAALSGTLMGMLAERVRSTVEQNFPEFHQRMQQHTEQQATRGGQGQSGWFATPPAAGPSGAGGQTAGGSAPIAERAELGGSAPTGSGAAAASSAASTDAAGRSVNYYGAGSDTAARSRG